MGFGAQLVEEIGERDACHFQCQERERRREADVPLSLQAVAVHFPASGYYEWRTESVRKQPYYFSAADEGVLSIAGLWDQWTDIESGEPLLSCTLIVTA